MTKDGKIIENLFHGENRVSEVYKGGKLIWKDQLPPYYIELPWIQADGTQYINTGITWLNEACSVDVKFDNTPGFGNKGFLMGTRIGYDKLEFSLFYSTPTSIRINAWKEVSKYLNSLPTVKDCIVHIRPLKAGSNNGPMTDFPGTADKNFIYGGPLYLFQCNTSNNITEGYYGYFKMSYVKIWDETGKLRSWFTPALRLTDSTPGMYDRVTGQFFTSASGTPFKYPKPLWVGYFNGYEVGNYYSDQADGSKVFNELVRMKVLTGKENWEFAPDTQVLFCESLLTNNEYNSPSLIANKTYKFTGTFGWTISIKDKYYTINKTEKTGRLQVNDPRFLTAESWKAHLKEMYDKGEPLIIWYGTRGTQAPVKEPPESVLRVILTNRFLR